MAVLAPRMAASRNFCTGRPLASVSMSQSYTSAKGKGVVPSSEGYQKVQEKQTKWNGDENLVWHLGGSADNMTAYFTFGVCVAAVGLCCAVLWEMSWPKKQE